MSFRERLRRALPYLFTLVGGGVYAVLLARGGVGYSSENRPMPRLTASRLDDGQAVSEATFRGQPLILNVWAPSCAPCRHELPSIDKLAAEYQGKVQFLGLVSFGTNAEAREILRSGGLSHLPELAGGQDFLDTLEVDSVPTTFFIRADGTIAGRQVGMRGEGFFRDKANALLAGKL